jgi:hypothetical protein
MLPKGAWLYMLRVMDNIHILHMYTTYASNNVLGHIVVQLDEALHYKLEDHGFKSQCSHWNFSIT